MKLFEKKKKRQRLISTFKWLIIIIVLAWLIMLIKDFLEHFQFLVARVNEQADQINNMSGQLNELKQANVQLSDQLHMAEMKISELTNEKLVQQPPKVNIVGATETIRSENPIQPISAPVVIVTVLVVLKGLASLVPAL